jgi:hypothetical protein
MKGIVVIPFHGVKDLPKGTERSFLKKANLEEMINEVRTEDEEIKSQLKNGYTIRYEVDLESVFNLIPEVNITQLANLIKMNPGLLRQYVSGTKTASEKQTHKVMEGIRMLTEKLKSIQLTV